MTDVTRRSFVKQSAAISAGAAVGIGALKRSTAAWAGANERVRVAVLGMSRGDTHIRCFSGIDNVEVTTICDIDESRLAGMAKKMEENGLPAPKLETDLRRVNDDPEIDVVSVALPNHWHTLASIWAMQAGKDVFVEKPISNNVWEGQQLIAATRKYDRVCQHGTQIRSMQGSIEGIQKLHDGIIGDVYMARGLCYKKRNTIGIAPEEPVPPGVHYDLWMGPAPKRPFTRNRFHYQWHWQWAYGAGDIGNQGVHQLDVARWGLGVDFPTKVTSMGQHFMFDDDQETPNTMVSSFWYPDCGKKGAMLVFEVRHWITNKESTVMADKPHVTVGNIFYGSEGIMVFTDYDSYETYFGQDMEPGPSLKAGSTADHFVNFVDAVRKHDQSLVTCPPEEGHISSCLGHLANISHRVGRSLEFDPATQTFKDDEANGLLTYDYRDPYVVPKLA